jgi:hypothetical protein
LKCSRLQSKQIFTQILFCCDSELRKRENRKNSQNLYLNGLSPALDFLMGTQLPIFAPKINIEQNQWYHLDRQCPDRRPFWKQWDERFFWIHGENICFWQELSLRPTKADEVSH